jgi:hypothetical protein
VPGESSDTAYLFRRFGWWLSAKQHGALASAQLASTADAPQVPESSGKTIELFEAIARFPSAPVYSIHRKREYHFKMPERVNYHTMRIMRRPWEGQKPSRISRVYLFHNGLNESENITFYYEIAARLLDEDANAACVLRPFPGHLSRHPFPAAYAEMPLDRYLLDAGDLFRQFVRFMLETQWLLSVVVPCRSYRVVAGLDLLAEGDCHREGRDSPAELAQEIEKSWASAFAANAPPSRPEDQRAELGECVTPDAVRGVICVIRHLIGWEPGHTDPVLPPAPKSALLPFVHAVGYSLGGFLAQSVFFTWPFAVSSCTTICSGGTLRDVALTAFASPEEWQTVMHALRYEMQSSMIEQRIIRDGDRVAGIDLHVFSSLHRIFHAVFLQDFRGSYRSRVSEYIARLFFIVGGNDPIVSMRAVMEAAPREGINLIEVANLSHFPLRGDVEWQDFWLPEVVGTMGHFAERTEDLLLRTLQENWWNKERTKWWDGNQWTDKLPEEKDEAGTTERAKERHGTGPRGRVPMRLRQREADPETGNEALSSDEFQMEMQTMVDVLPQGWLLVVRNDVPAALLGPKLLHRRGTALHHSDDAIRRYVSGLNRRREAMMKKENRDRITLVIPAPLEKWFKREQPIFSGKVEAAAFRVPSEQDLAEIWQDFFPSWASSGALRQFSPSSAAEPRELDDEITQRFDTTQSYPVLNTLPDLWIAFDGRAVEQMVSTVTPDRANCQSAFLTWAVALNKDDGRAKERLEGWLRNEWLRVVKVSAAEFNPRFMGWRIRDPRRARVSVVHAALACTHSRPCPQDG